MRLLVTQLQGQAWWDRHMHQALLSFAVPKADIAGQTRHTTLYTAPEAGILGQTRNNTYTAPGADMVGQTAVVHFSHTLPYKRSTWLKNAKAKGKKKPLIIVGHQL